MFKNSPNFKKFLLNKRSLIISSFLLLAFIFLYFNFSSSEIKVVENESSVEKIEIQKIVPTEETIFFTEETNAPILWYAEYKNNLEFFTQKGVHPITGDKLLPVTKEIVDEYKRNNELKNKEKDSLRHIDISIKGKIIKSKRVKEKPIKKKTKKRNSIWNTNLVNRIINEEVSIFAFNNQNKLDVNLLSHFKNEFLKKDYIVTKQIIYNDAVTNLIATKLKERDVDYFKGNLKKYTDYICIAIASYSYEKNTIRKDMLDCEMKVDYYIYSTDTGEIMLSESDKVIGTGQSKNKSRISTIKELVL